MNLGRAAALVAAMLLSFAGTLAFRVSVPAVSFYTRSVLEASALGVGLLTSAFFVARASTAVAVGSAVDRWPKALAFAPAPCFALNALAVQLYAYASTLPQVLGIRFLQGVLNGVAWVTVQYLLGRVTEERYRGRAYAIYFASGSLGGVAGNAIYSALAREPMGVVLAVSSSFFLAASGLATLLAYLSKGFLGPALLSTRRGRRPGGQRGGSAVAAALLLTVVMGVSVFGSILRGDLVYVYLNEVLGLGRGGAAAFVASASLVALMGGYLLSWLSDRVGEYRALTVATSIAFVGAVCSAITSPLAALLGIALFYTSQSAVTSVSRRAAVTRYRLGGTVLGLLNASSNAGSVAGAALAGWLYDTIGPSRLILLNGTGASAMMLLMCFAPLASLVAATTLTRTEVRK